MDNAVHLDRVVKRFGDFTAVSGISLQIPRGQLCGFLGPNGAGKTTTLRMIMNILRPDEGRLEVLGRPSSEDVKTRIGYLPEERGLYKNMRVLDLLVYFGRLKGMDGREARPRAQALLEEWDLGSWRQRKCKDLSKGMQQKLQFLATIIHEPDLLILDEPFSGLDPVNTELLKDKILELRGRGTTVLFSTHVVDQAERICDSVLLINRGRKVLDGRVEEVKASGSTETAVLLEYEGSGDRVKSLPLVARVNDFGHYMEITLRNGASPDELLRQVAPHLSIRKFEVRQPSLNEIFLRTVRDAERDSPAADPVAAMVAAEVSR
jgi:ABC-2 type transport system ATP-binding protein